MEIVKKYKELNKKIFIDGDHLVKVYNNTYSKADIFNAALNSTIVEETDLKIAKIVQIEKIGEEWAIVAEHISGESLEEKMDKDPRNVDKYLDYFVSLQLEVQSKKCPRLPLMKDKLKKKISSLALDSQLKYVLLQRIDNLPSQSKLTHGDFNPSNIILNDKGEYVIIDWSHAASGSGAADAAFTYLYFAMNGKENIAVKYLDKFCVKSEYNRRTITRWIPLIAASMLPYFANDSSKEDYLMKWTKSALENI